VRQTPERRNKNNQQKALNSTNEFGAFLIRPPAHGQQDQGRPVEIPGKAGIDAGNSGQSNKQVTADKCSDASSG
jgi:hypothetical protein